MAAYGEHDVAVVTRGVRGKLNPAAAVVDVPVAAYWRSR
jgi:hypothetical protein